MNAERWVKEHLLVGLYAGSRLYGTARPDSDYDYRGVCLSPPEALIGLHEFKQYQSSKDDDLVIYELRRFCHLALGANPNILDILFAPPEVWLESSSAWADIYLHRHRFLSQKVRHTFSGYAFSQLKRLQRHREWLVNPPDHEPHQEEFGGVWDGATYQFPKIAREKEYRAARKRWDNYQRWLRERNPARAELERKYGYDCKHASHLVRLLVQAKHLLREGTYTPRLVGDELDMVCGVLHGEWDYDRLIRWASAVEARVREMPTKLPKKPQHKAVEELCMRIYRDFLLQHWRGREIEGETHQCARS